MRYCQTNKDQEITRKYEKGLILTGQEIERLYQLKPELRYKISKGIIPFNKEK